MAASRTSKTARGTDPIAGHETLHELESLGRPAPGFRGRLRRARARGIVAAYADPEGGTGPEVSARSSRAGARPSRGRVGRGGRRRFGPPASDVRQQRRRFDRAVDSMTSRKADMVTDGYVIDAGRRDRSVSSDRRARHRLDRPPAGQSRPPRPHPRLRQLCPHLFPHSLSGTLGYPGTRLSVTEYATV